MSLTRSSLCWQRQLIAHRCTCHFAARRFCSRTPPRQFSSFPRPVFSRALSPVFSARSSDRAPHPLSACVRIPLRARAPCAMFSIFDRIHSPQLPGGPPPSALERSSVDDVVRADLARVKDSLPLEWKSHVEEHILDGAAFGTIQNHPRVSWAEHRAPENGGRVFVVLYGSIALRAKRIRIQSPLPLFRVSALLRSMHSSSPSSQYTVPPSHCSPPVFPLFSLPPPFPPWRRNARWETQQGFSDAYGDYSSQPQTCLASLQGSWAFCLFDDASQYVLAARDPHHGAPLFWASVQQADLLFCTWSASPSSIPENATHPAAEATDAAADAAAAPDAPDAPDAPAALPPPPLTAASVSSTAHGLELREFPAGFFYEKKWDETIGSLHSYMEGEETEEMDVSVPMPCATMFRVSSGSDLAGPKPGSFAM
ncbi:unnamed protein product [Closterium sp. NIES-54]